MLYELNIKNLALIDELSLNLDQGLTVLTGETGAGKSIILQAIHLLSGGKASAKWVRSGADQAVIEALFEVTESSHVHTLLDDHGFSAETSIILKRVVSSKGRSRFYINGSLATAKLTTTISEHLLSVASQHDHQLLLSPPFQLDFVDGAGNLFGQRFKVAELFSKWQKTKQELAELQEDEREKQQRHDFLSYQVNEIEAAALVPAEDEELEQEKRRLKSSAQLHDLGRKSYEELNRATNNLAQVRKNLEQMATLDPEAEAISAQVAEPAFILEDQLLELRHYLDNLPSDLGQLEEIGARLDLINQLKRKYGSTIPEIITFGQQARADLSQLDSQGERRDELLEQEKKLATSYEQAAQKLSKARGKETSRLAKAISSEISSLCLENGQFKISLSHEKPSRHGLDRVEFLFSANLGEPLKPVAQIASGGELSRLLLGLKTVLARQDQVETVIFDEVDSGISGKAAESVARKIRGLADQQQVLCITHLPQIAALADEHFLVEKRVNAKRTISEICKLPADKRPAALATMLDGDSAGEQTLVYAQELMARRSKNSHK
ncbi:MAG: DNA repair protein RecN [Thermodesulfobacteriota bacterium]